MNDKPTLHQLAALAMQGILAHHGYAKDRGGEIARQAYDMAEAMEAEAQNRGHQRSPEFE